MHFRADESVDVCRMWRLHVTFSILARFPSLLLLCAKKLVPFGVLLPPGRLGLISAHLLCTILTDCAVSLLMTCEYSCDPYEMLAMILCS